MIRQEIESNASNVVLAGSETSATMMLGVVVLLLQNKEYLSELINELRDTFALRDDITVDACARSSLLLGRHYLTPQYSSSNVA